jgi:hypothetical protein
VSGVLSFAPLDLVNLLLDLERLEIIELGLMRLELCVKLVFAALLLQDRRKRGNRFSDEIQPARGTASGQRKERTCSLRSNRTTRPPLSPVAR